MARPTAAQMKAIRENCMLTMREVSEQTGLSLNTVWSAENPARRSRIKTLQVLLRFYELHTSRNQATADLVAKYGNLSSQPQETPGVASPRPKPSGASATHQ